MADSLACERLRMIGKFWGDSASDGKRSLSRILMGKPASNRSEMGWWLHGEASILPVHCLEGTCRRSMCTALRVNAQGA